MEPLLGSARPSLQLKAGAVGDVKPGSTRLGGDPDLPPDTVWPEVKGRPLRFFAQLRLEELPLPEDWPMPRSGLLSVFEGDDEARFDVEHALLFSPEPAELIRRPTPELDEDLEPLRSCPVTAGFGITLPGYGDRELNAMELEDDEMDAYFALQDDLRFSRDAALLGRDYDVDKRPTETHAIAVLGGPPYDYEWQRENAEAIRREASRWVPLFQMDSSFSLGLNMWDAYTFLVLIRWEDLRAGRFDRTHAQLARR